MKILLYLWNSNNESILRTKLIEAGHTVVDFSQKCTHYTRDIDLARCLIFKINAEHIDAVVSFNYFPIISLACDATKIVYYSWVYDCPHLTLFAKTVNLACNRIGIFDRGMVEDLRQKGVDTVFHLPLAVDVAKFEDAISQNKCKMFGKNEYDVSFVGSLYTDGHNYFDLIYNDDVSASVSNYLKKYAGNYTEYPSYMDIDEDDLIGAAIKMSEQGLMLSEDYFAEPLDIVMSSVFEKKLTVIERDVLFHKLSKKKNIRFALYTNSKTDIPNCGTVRYMDEMPCVFNATKINLNVTLRSIHSGIPLRVMDIMASGGFVLSNYQPEICELFKENEEIAVFRTMSEAIEKVQYFLEHDDERRRIALAGKKAVQERFCYEKQLKILLNE